MLGIVARSAPTLAPMVAADAEFAVHCVELLGARSTPALPALYRWAEVDEERCIGLPVIDKTTKRLSFHMWFPGCEMEEDAYGIPKPKDTDEFMPELLVVPCLGYGPGGVRLGYGGGFYDRTLATLEPQPYTVGVAYSQGYVPWLKGEPHDVPLDAILTEDGVAWQATEAPR